MKTRRGIWMSVTGAAFSMALIVQRIARERYLDPYLTVPLPVLRALTIVALPCLIGAVAFTASAWIDREPLRARLTALSLLVVWAVVRAATF